MESGTRDMVIQDFRDRMEERKQSVGHARSAIGLLGGTCSVLAVLVLAGGLVMFGNYRKMKDMEAVIASVMPSDVKTGGLRSFAGQDEDGNLEVESVPGEVYPTLADIVIDQGTGNDVNASGNDAAGMEAGADAAGNTNAGTSASVVQIPSDAVKYVVQEGETLYGICIERYHSMAQIPQICAWNGLADENHISVGQELYLPAK